MAVDLEPRDENIHDIRDEFTLVTGEITNERFLERTFDRYRPTRVLHFAAKLIDDAATDPQDVITVNFLGTSRVFEAVRDYDVGRCVYASTAGVYGTAEEYGVDETEMLHETDLVKPRGVYGATKYLNEATADQYNPKSQSEFIGIRIGGVWGRGRLSGSTGQFTNFLRESALGQDVEVPEEWVHIFGLTGDIYASYAKDFGRWVAKLATRPDLAYTLYNQRNRHPFTLQQMASILEARIPETEVAIPKATTRPDGSNFPVLDVTRWYDDLKFEQRWGIDAALFDFVNYHREREELSRISHEGSA